MSARFSKDDSFLNLGRAIAGKHVSLAAYREHDPRLVGIIVQLFAAAG